MKSSVSLCTEPLPLPRSHLADVIELVKPRIAVMVLFTVAAGAFLAGAEAADLLLIVNTLAGTALLATGASVLNQVIEKNTDALMRRTENRPLPSGRLHPLEGFTLGLLLSVGGLAFLILTSRHAMPVCIGAFTLLSYVLVYTPLKRHTTWNTVIGAVPGALPPVIGWTAITGSFDIGALALFLVLFLWQMPHFFAIAWIYREDYGRAGLKMVPVQDPYGTMTAVQMVFFCLALLGTSLIPTFAGIAGWIFVVGAVSFGLYFLRSTIGFWQEKTNLQAKKVLYASLFYLPGVLALWLVDYWVQTIR